MVLWLDFKRYKTCVCEGFGALTIFSALARTLPAVPGSGCAVGVKGTSEIGTRASTIQDGAVGAAAAGTMRAAAAESVEAPVTVTAKDAADAFEVYIAAYNANSTNFLAYAPGGGVENIGLSK